MTSDVDYYAVLGVLPGAESVVIVAAYRALASLYHPDKWKGNVSSANKRMAEINVAYGVLSDAEKRKAYDSTLVSPHAKFTNDEEFNDEVFDDALAHLESSWLLATELYPDLVAIRTSLTKVSHKLSFAFVTLILETKRFKQRNEIAPESVT
jgi:curved DNA-binding protein CbpA